MLEVGKSNKRRRDGSKAGADVTARGLQGPKTLVARRAEVEMPYLCRHKGKARSIASPEGGEESRDNAERHTS